MTTAVQSLPDPPRTGVLCAKDHERICADLYAAADSSGWRSVRAFGARRRSTDRQFWALLVRAYDLKVIKIAPPLTERQAVRIQQLGLLADDPAALQTAWTNVRVLWADAVAEASRLGDGQLDTRVNDEWSFIETLRHLIFVTDVWIGDAVLENVSPYDPIGLPPDFITHARELGLDLDAHPSLAHVLDSRGRRMAEVHDAIADTTLEGLDRPCKRFDGQFTVLGAFQNVIFEEWAHHYYAMRDLALM